MWYTSRLSTGAIILNTDMNDLHNATYYSNIHHFTDDINLLYLSKSF